MALTWLWVVVHYILYAHLAMFTLHDTYDETTSMLDTTVPLGEFLDEQLARAKEN